MTFTRPDGRTPTALRPITVNVGVSKFAEGSAEISFGDTKVILRLLHTHCPGRCELHARDRVCLSGGGGKPELADGRGAFRTKQVSGRRALATDPIGSILHRYSDALIPEARSRAARPCLEGSKSRNRLSEVPAWPVFF